MANVRRYEQEYVPSILDRLTYSAAKGEIGELRPESRQALEAAIQRHLTALLNTSRDREPQGPEYPECEKSLLNFGLPDITTVNLRLASEQNWLRGVIENAVQMFEPRLTGVNVSLERWDEAKPYLRFQIEAFLVDEPLVFDTVLRSDSAEFVVERKST